jgi:hypothetical protein
MAQLCPPRLGLPWPLGHPRFRLNRRSAALLFSCPDGSDGKLDSRLACAHARVETANAMSGQICRCGPVLRLRVRGVLSSLWGTPLLRGRIVAKWRRFMNHCESEFSHPARGRGFNCLKRGRPRTAHDLMRRFFLAPGVLNYFSEFKEFKRRPLSFPLSKQGYLAIEPRVLGICFLRPRGTNRPNQNSQKLSRNSRGGGGVWQLILRGQHEPAQRA